MCDEKVKPQTVTGKGVEYTANAPGQAVCIQEAECLLLSAIGKFIAANNGKSSRDFYILAKIYAGHCVLCSGNLCERNMDMM